MSSSKQNLENRLSYHEVVSKDLQAFQVELDKEFKSRFELFELGVIAPLFHRWLRLS